MELSESELINILEYRIGWLKTSHDALDFNVRLFDIEEIMLKLRLVSIERINAYTKIREK